MSARGPNLFVERETYRRRRLLDAARVLPVLGIALWLVPLLWPDTPEEGVPMSRALVYVFGVWAALILCAFLFGLKVRMRHADDAPAPRQGGGQPR